MGARQWTDDEKEKAIAHFIAELEKGTSTANLIMADMPRHNLRRLSKQILHDWRAADPELAARIDEAFEVGCDRKAEDTARIAAGEEGYSSGNVKRDRLMMSWAGKQLSVWNHRYRDRQVHTNDPENPMPAYAPPQFIIQPVAPAAQPELPDVDLPAEDEENGV